MSRPHPPRGSAAEAAGPDRVETAGKPGTSALEAGRVAAPCRVLSSGGSTMLLMRPPIDGGTIVLTGASGGIGRELALQLAGRAGCVALVARTVERLEGLRDELAARHPQLQVVVVSADLSDQAEVSEPWLPSAPRWAMWMCW